MTTLTLELDDDLARHVEQSALREQKSVSDWVKERLKPEAERAALLAEMESRAIANGYPQGWMTLYGSLADDDRFVSPARSRIRPVAGLDRE